MGVGTWLIVNGYWLLVTRSQKYNLKLTRSVLDDEMENMFEMASSYNQLANLFNVS